MIFDVNDYVEPQKPRLYLCKPNRETIGELKEAFGIQRNARLGNVFTLDFNIPYQIEIRHKLVRNPHADIIRNRYLIRFEQGNTKEWYIIKSPTDSMNEDSDVKSITTYLLPIQLADKKIRNLNLISKNASYLLGVALQETNWTVGYVDAGFDTLFREVNITDSNVLDFIFQIATTFNALVDFDTVNRKVNLNVFDDYGTNKGLEASYGNLLKSAKKVENDDEFYTRWKVFGADGIGINGQNPTGQNYIEDYSWFIFPFERDVNKNVLSHSFYLSDNLCHSLLDYRDKVAAAKGTYTSLLSQLSSYQQTLTTQQNDLQTLKNDLAVIEDEIAVLNYNGQSTAAKVTEKNNKLSQISSQNSLIATTQSNINSVNSQITTLQSTLAINSNFTSEQIEEWIDFQITGTFEITNVSDPVQLLQLAEAEFEKVKQPKIIVEISLVNFLECVTEQKRWGMLNLGDTIKIKNANVGIDVQAKIIEISYDYESGEINLVISNVKELLDDKSRFLRDLYRANTTSGVVTSNESKWNGAYDSASEAQQILNGVWDATARQIQASVDNTVNISRKGVIVSDPNTPNDILILQKGLLAISGDGGNNWKTAINKDGVHAPRLVGQILLGTNLTISNTAGSVNIDGTGMTVSNMNLTISRSDNKSRIKMNATDGIKIQSSTDGITWTDKLYADTNGDLIVNNITANNITANSATINSSSWNGGFFQGNITATGTITGGSLVGANITTTAGIYPNIELSSAINLLKASYNAQQYMAITPFNGTAPALQLVDNINNKSLFVYVNASGSSISPTGDLFIAPNGGYIKIPSWSSLYSVAEGQTLRQAIDAAMASPPPYIPPPTG